MAIALILNGLVAYVLTGFMFAMILLAMLVQRPTPPPLEDILGMVYTALLCWPALLVAIWDDNQDGPWKG